MSYQFAGSLFDTRQQAVTTVVEEFLMGSPNRADVQAALDAPESTLRELLENWDTNIAQTGHDPIYPTVRELIDAMSEFDFVKNFPEE